VNFVAHALVAARLAPDRPDVGLGAMAPDLASMGRFRLDRVLLPAGVQAGVACHNATDTAFHGAPAVRDLMGDLRRRLAAAGLERGPCRAVGHVGVELAMDGVLLGWPDARGAVESALAERASVTGALAPGPVRAAWQRVADRLATDLDLVPYRNPAGTAELLHRILAARPQLAFPAEQVAVVAVELAATMATVGPRIGQIVADTVAAVAAAPWTAPTPAAPTPPNSR
jgi:hypothetical protein